MAACPRCSARRRCRRIASCGRSVSAARRVSAWEHLPADVATPRRRLRGWRQRVHRERTGALPPEFTLLRFEPEPWTGPDVLVWVKMMAWDLSANYSFELLRHDIAAQGRRRSDSRQLMPPYPLDGPEHRPGERPSRLRRAVERSTHSRTLGGGLRAASWIDGADPRRRGPSRRSRFPDEQRSKRGARLEQLGRRRLAARRAASPCSRTIRTWAPACRRSGIWRT